MSDSLPLEVIGWIGPILSWVEGGDALRVPAGWRNQFVNEASRERSWLVREYPTRSLDTLDDIISYTRESARKDGMSRSKRTPVAFPTRMQPANFRAAKAFEALSSRYFEWIGERLSIRRGSMVEIHELALRFPVEHLIRYRYVTASRSSILTRQLAVSLPVSLGRLESSSTGLNVTVRKGLAEGHLHLNGIIGASEAWADSLLPQLSSRNRRSGPISALKPEERRIVVLGRYAALLLALGILLYRFRRRLNGRQQRGLFKLMGFLDGLYRVTDRRTEYRLIQLLDVGATDACRTLVKELGSSFASGQQIDASGENGRGPFPLKGDMALLMRWISPSLWSLHKFARDRRILRPERLAERANAIGRLIFCVQEILCPPFPAGRAKDDGSGDERSRDLRELIERIYFRYLVYQTHHWQLVTQGGKTTGLRRFKQFESSPLRRIPRSRDRVDAQITALSKLTATGMQHCIEGRVSPPERADGADLAPWIFACLENGRQPPKRFGLVLHFIKNDRDEMERSASLRYPRIRHSGVRRRTEEEALRLFRLLASPSPMNPFIAGIDAANVELTTPPEVFAPAFRFLRESPIGAKARAPYLDRHQISSRVRSMREGRRLGMTYHVGEDFRHILSGLRAIDETILFLNARPGDRLGHALALGQDPLIWAEQNGHQALLPRQDWLDTLVWLHNLLGPGHDLVGRLGVEDSIQRLACQIYGSSYQAYESSSHGEGQLSRPIQSISDLNITFSPLTLFDAWRLRQLDPFFLELAAPLSSCPRLRFRSPHGAEQTRWAHVQSVVLKEVKRDVGSNAAYRLAWLYWLDLGVRVRGSEIIKVEMREKQEKWLQVCREAQSLLQERVKRRQLIVESNPSSNSVIGPMTRLSQHQLFNLTLDSEFHLKHDIRLTVNSDDPGIFNTSLEHEYYLLGEILMQEGASEAQTSRWLNWLRQNGLDYRFDLPEFDDQAKAVIQGLGGAARREYRIQSAKDRLNDFFDWLEERRPAGRRNRRVS